MEPAKVVREEASVDDRLMTGFGVSKEELIKVVREVVAARNGAVQDDPITARGTFAYIFGTRGLRRLLRPKGWIIERTDNIEATFDPERGVKIIYQNTDSAADPFREPKAVAGKGPAAERMIENAQPYLFEEFEEEDRLTRERARKRSHAEAWFLCVAVEGKTVRAELSRPRSVEDRQFNGFVERIFIIDGDDWDGLEVGGFDDDSNDQDFDVSVTKK